MKRLIAITAFLMTVCVSREASFALTVSDSEVRFRHYAYDLNPDQTVRDYHTGRIVTRVFPVKIIENEWIKITVLPDFGGRILSWIYKPTGHELLYQNPLGTVQGWKELNFYYDYLMVYGGIFPTYPVAEHGKTWQTPWNFQFLETNSDRVTFEMRLTDSADPVKRTERKFTYGKTWLTCIVTVTVRKDSSAVEWTVRLINNQPKYVLYEYWTCMTLAPGSTPGKPSASGACELVIPTTHMKLKNDWWPWMDAANAGEPVDDNVFTFNRLSFYSNWQDMGIAYAYPSVTNGWYGLLNRENNVGVFRFTPDPEETPGLKIWTWGYEPSRGEPRGGALDHRRPYVEYFSGTTTEFFTPSRIAPLDTKTWTEYFLPTAGLSNVNFATARAAGYFSAASHPDGKTRLLTAEIFSAEPGQELRAEFYLSAGKKPRLVSSSVLAGNPSNTVLAEAVLTNSRIPKGTTELLFILRDRGRKEMARAVLPCADTKRN